jgi:uncharacterized protein (TIRG00374 family)
LGWIVRQVYTENPDKLWELATQPKDYGRLTMAVVVYLAAIVITFWRWFILVRAIDLPFRFRDALRLGFVGFFFQFLSLGAVGGDLFKAVFLAREQPDRRPEAVATVFIDRAVGLFALLILTCIVFVLLGWEKLNEDLHTIAIFCLVLTAIAFFVVAGLLWTNLTTRPIRKMLKSFPAVCAILLRGEHAVQMYRDRRGWFVLAVLSGLLSHTLLASSAYFSAVAVTTNPPDFQSQVVMWNIAGAVGTLPLSPGGLGTFETAYSKLYEVIPVGGRPLEDGFVVSLILRVISVIIAAIGVAVYFVARKEMKQLLTEAESAE